MITLLKYCNFSLFQILKHIKESVIILKKKTITLYIHMYNKKKKTTLCM